MHHDLPNLIGKNIGKLNILPQWVCDKNGNISMHVPIVAPSFGTEPKPGTINYQISEELVAAQFKAYAQMCVVRSIETGKPCPMHLSLVGLGIFHNNPAIMNKALQEVAEVVKGYDIPIVLHVYKIQGTLDKLSTSGAVTFKTMTEKEFTAYNPSNVSVSPNESPREREHRRGLLSLFQRDKDTKRSEMSSTAAAAATLPTAPVAKSAVSTSVSTQTPKVETTKEILKKRLTLMLQEIYGLTGGIRVEPFKEDQFLLTDLGGFPVKSDQHVADALILVVR